jgi:large subunit ribosomal protein L10
MNREQKTATVDAIAEQIESAHAVFAIDYRGISVPQAAELRTRLREADATFRVVKNSLTERAADQAGAPALRPLLDGPTALTFVRGDAAVAAKALADFARAESVLDFKGGLMGEEELSSDQIRSIARLPARDVLFGQLVGTVASPLTGLAQGLNGLLSGVAIALGQIAERGLLGSPDSPPKPEAPADAEAEPESAEDQTEAADAPADAADQPEAEADAPADAASDDDAAEAKEEA